MLNSGEIVISKDEYLNFIETNKINSIVLLAQAGYFSIKKSIPDAFVIGFPNKDVAQSSSKLILSILTNKGNALVDLGLSGIKKALLNCDLNEIVNKLNKLYLSIVYDNKDSLSSELVVRSIAQA